ncbi:hypothetical protein PIB30_053043 [Stylosanthes scabra]|uniref:Putative plant transposon protein domain-containing protein n=1 Tax=Stylosanthes scabra TaxID=79078 RepID=A0ABU6TI34_9FABA|nr:hypothetical protein [Stylosanthes scabra]
MKFKGPLDIETSYKTRMVPTNQDLDVVIRDLCVEGAVWDLGARNNLCILKCTDLNPIAKVWHNLIIHDILPTQNQSEVTINRAVLIHCIMQGQEVRVEKIIVDEMMKIIHKLHFSKTPLALLNIIARLCDGMEVSYLASRPGEAISKAKVITTSVMENIKPPPQPHFHHEQPCYDAANMPQGYGWGNCKKTWATSWPNRLLMVIASKTWRQGRKTCGMSNISSNRMSDNVKYSRRNSSSSSKRSKGLRMLSMSIDCQARNMYTHWGLQQSNQNLVPIAPAKIPRMVRDNFKAGRPLFQGMLRSGPSEGSSSALDQQAPPAADAPREPNIDNN